MLDDRDQQVMFELINELKEKNHPKPKKPVRPKYKPFTGQVGARYVPYQGTGNPPTVVTAKPIIAKVGAIEAVPYLTGHARGHLREMEVMNDGKLTLPMKISLMLDIVARLKGVFDELTSALEAKKAEV